jgi:hypothetical protein
MEIFHPLQHQKMFDDRKICVICDSKEASYQFKLHLKSLGYIWQGGQDLMNWESLIPSSTYCASRYIKKALCLTSRSSYKHCVEFKCK